MWPFLSLVPYAGFQQGCVTIMVPVICTANQSWTETSFAEYISKSNIPAEFSYRCIVENKYRNLQPQHLAVYQVCDLRQVNV